MLGNGEKLLYIPKTDKVSLSGQSEFRETMKLRLWHVFTVEYIFICISSQALLEKRRCAFQVTTQNHNFTAAGNVSGSVQTCENTECCVSYFRIIDDQIKVDIQACALVEKSCPEPTCKLQRRFKNGLKCTCHTDLCNNNTILFPEPQQIQLTSSNHSEGKVLNVPAISFTSIIILIFFAALLRRFFTKQKENVSGPCDKNKTSDNDNDTIQLEEILDCGCLTPEQSCPPGNNIPPTKTSEIDIDGIELQKILHNGHFAAVYQGKYKGSNVAVKVFPADWKHKFKAEKNIYELPLMKHAGIVHYLGSGRKADDSSWFIVLQFAEYTLHSYLCKHTTDWVLSLKLCQSLSEGLSYLHSDLHVSDVHKPPVAHKDLSSSNVLVRVDGTCVLCDFGCSAILCCCSRKSHSQTTDMKGHAQMGTLRYMSPEILEGSVNLKNSTCFLQGDVYSLGLLLWEIWMRCTDLFEGGIVPLHLLPYESDLGDRITFEGLIQFVFHMQKRPSIPKQWEKLQQGFALQEILMDCWDCDPDARLTAQCVSDRLVSLRSGYFP